MKFLGVTILQGVEFPIFPIHFAWALQQQRYCAACDDVIVANLPNANVQASGIETARKLHYFIHLPVFDEPRCLL